MVVPHNQMPRRFADAIKINLLEMPKSDQICSTLDKSCSVKFCFQVVHEIEVIILLELISDKVIYS